MTALDRTVTYDQMIYWGAATMYDERHLRKWFSRQPTLTIADALDVRTEPSRILWLVMREELLPADAMHSLAVDLCRGFLDRLTADGVYVDFRSRRVLDEKRAWLDGHRSLGELHIARAKAARARDDVAELQDPRVSAGARAAFEALGDDAAHAVRYTAYAIRSIYDEPEDRTHMLSQVRAHLAALHA